MWRDHKITVVVPAFREEKLLPTTLETMPDYVDHIIVVDDGSTDQTFQIARRWAQQDGRIEALRLGFNYGVGRAITAGYERALAHDADVVAVMVADAQMDPADLPDVLAPVVEGRADYSKGDRLSHGDRSKMPTIRRLGTALLARITGAVAGQPDLRDSQCGYTAISASMLRQLPLDELYPSYGYPNDLLLRLAERDARIAQPRVRPVYADEISGLKITSVALPISAILLRGILRRFFGTTTAETR